jgi:hypothetical protein
MRKLVGTFAVAALCLGASAGIATSVEAEGAPATQSETEDMAAVRVPGTDIALQYPGAWRKVKLPKSASSLRGYLKQYPKMGDMAGLDATTASNRDLQEFWDRFQRDVVLVRINPTDGDKVVVSTPKGDWYPGFDVWKSLSKQSADATHGEVLADTQTKFGSHPAFTHLERDADGVWAVVDMKNKGGTTITISIRTDELDPAVVQSIIDSVHSVSS